MPFMVFGMRPLKATNDMQMASAHTPAIDHLDDSRAKNFARRLRSKEGRNRQKARVKILIVGKTTLNISTNTPTIHISGRPMVDRKSTRLNSSHLGISYA